ncbi:MAG: ribosomal protein S18-alanine N-acetyltransferase [Candidatus Nanopelagicales bacterium]
MSIEMRDATKLDIPSLLSIENVLFQDEAWSREVFESEFALLGTTRTYRVIEENNEIVAYFGLAIVDDTADITTIAVRADFQGRGIGRKLMQEILDIAASRNLRKIMLEVKPENLAAISLYQKYDFEVIGIRRNYYGPSKDALTMQKLVNSD